MKTFRLPILAAAVLGLGLAGCADPVGQRALIGGGLGAAGGAGIAALTGGSPLAGAAIGGAGGAAVGALTAPRQRRGYY
jgi:osmotically inducible lipoprotein OsmB